MKAPKWRNFYWHWHLIYLQYACNYGKLLRKILEQGLVTETWSRVKSMQERLKMLLWLKANLLHVSANGGILAAFGQRSGTEERTNSLHSKLENTTNRPVAFQFNILCHDLGFEIQNNQANRIDDLPVSFQTSSSEYVLTLFGNNHTAAAYVNRQWVICEAETGGENGFTII